MKLTVCASCKAPVFFAVVNHGKSGPIDAEPVESGNLRMISSEYPVQMTTHNQLELGENDDGLRYVSHFSTCPHAEDWRGGRPTKADTPGPKYRRFRHA